MLPLVPSYISRHLSDLFEIFIQLATIRSTSRLGVCVCACVIVVHSPEVRGPVCVDLCSNVTVQWWVFSHGMVDCTSVLSATQCMQKTGCSYVVGLLMDWFVITGLVL